MPQRASGRSAIRSSAAERRAHRRPAARRSCPRPSACGCGSRRAGGSPRSTSGEPVPFSPEDRDDRPTGRTGELGLVATVAAAEALSVPRGTVRREAATLGDVMLDVIVPARAAARARGRRARPHATGAGQAANVAAWAACSSRPAASPARQRCGRALVARELESHGVELVTRSATAGPASSSRSSAPTATARWLPIAASRRHIRARRRLGPVRRAPPVGLRATAWAIAHAAPRCASLRARCPHLVGIAAWTEIRAYGPVRFRELLDTIAPDVLFATEAEWEMLGGAYLPADRPHQARRAAARSSPKKATDLARRGGGRRLDRRGRRPCSRVPPRRLARGRRSPGLEGSSLRRARRQLP